jgi:hypothetical protein
MMTSGVGLAHSRNHYFLGQGQVWNLHCEELSGRLCCSVGSIPTIICVFVFGLGAISLEMGIPRCSYVVR